MKNLITSLVFLVGVLGFGQSKSMNGMVVKNITKVENIAVTINVDSAEDIESSFKTEDLREILGKASDDEDITFKIICNSNNKSTGYKSSASYQIKGNTNETDNFLKTVEKIRTAAINYYNNKN